MFCEKCGSYIEDGSAFCEYCGAKVKGNQRVNMGQPVPNVSEYMESGKKSSSDTKKVLIVVAVFAVVLILGAVGIFAMKKSKEKQRAALDDLYSITEDVAGNTESDITYETPEYDLPEYEEAEGDYEYEEQEALDQKVEEYIIYGSDSRYISWGDLAGFTAEECRLARNEIYARHGRMFNDAGLQSYFNSKSWYYPSIDADDFTDCMLNQYEKENVKVIAEYEEEQGYR